ncbi:MAG: PA2169 family four-helix-bundle protein [Phycisphaerales bacterium JB063]
MTRMETVTNLKDETIDSIKDLVRINQDSAEGFAQAAEAVEHADLKGLFSLMAGQRQQFANELRSYVVLNDEDGDISSSWQGMFHRWWLDLWGKLSGGDAYAVLAEAERGEDKIKAMYEEVIKDTTGNPLNDVLHRQYADVKKGHDSIRDLRDAVKAAQDNG